jgi:hypothetical protein
MADGASSEPAIPCGRGSFLVASAPGSAQVPFDGQPARIRSGGSLSGRIVIALAVAALGAGAVWVIVVARRPVPVRSRVHGVKLLTTDRAFPPEGRYAGDPYIGPDACAECHPGEAAHQSRTGHAQTLWPVGRRALARRLDGTTVADP